MSSRRSRRKKNKEKKGGILITSVIVIFGAIGGFVLYAMVNKQGIDEATNCPTDGISYHKAILIDISQSYAPVQKNWIKNQLKQIVSGTEKSEKISVYAVGANNHENILPLLSRCNPGDASGVNPFIENKRMKQEDWEKEFIDPLNIKFNDLLDSSEGTGSPIMEMVQAISIAAFQNEKLSTKKQLFIFSDMLQHTAEVSHYKGSLNFKKFSDSPAYLRIRTDLDGVTVKIFYIRRFGHENIQKGTVHAKFWQEYFNSMGVDGFSIKFGEG
jgi:hypothetical protein